MILHSRRELLHYFKARNLPALEAQFNFDGRAYPVVIDVDTDDKIIGIATAPESTCEVLSHLHFPVHVSDLLGRIAIDQQCAAMRGMQ